jgi:hypothetical protein
MVCDEVKVFIVFQLVQWLVQWLALGKELVMRSMKATALLATLGWIVLLYFLCQRNYRRFTWWFVAISVGLGAIYDIALFASPTFRDTVKKTVEKATRA